MWRARGESRRLVTAHSSGGWPGIRKRRGLPFHNGGINFNFVDGHVKWFSTSLDMTQASGYQLTSSETTDYWSLDGNP
jgi:prepilin-type processing-associated H-X9-DG protein